ncbi:MAG: hypothetical protein ACK4I8_04985 [Armatimonadota bacterium]
MGSSAIRQVGRWAIRQIAELVIGELTVVEACVPRPSPRQKSAHLEVRPPFLKTPVKWQDRNLPLQKRAPQRS